MTRALLLCLAGALGANAEHTLCDTCDEAGLSLLQRAGRSKDSLELARFPGARIVYVEVPISPALALVAGPAGLLGDTTPGFAGGPLLDIKNTAKLWIADFPSAQIGWQGIPGASPRLDLPHHLLSVQLPVFHRGERMCHSVYALVDDDEVMLLMRMGEGVPAKLAEFELNASRLLVRRRGVDVLAAELELGPTVEAAELGDVFARADLTRLGTQVQRPGSLLLRRSTRAQITSAQQLLLHNMHLSDNHFEPLASLLGNLSGASAWLLEADLEVSTVVAGPAGPVPNFIEAIKGSSGAPTTQLQPERGNMNYQNGQVVWLQQKVNPAVMARLLPPGVEAEEGPALVFVVHWQPAAIYVNFGNVSRSDEPFVYSELWLIAQVRFKGRRFNHPIVMLLDDDVALMTGHDMMGCPKKMSNFTMKVPETAELKAPVSMNVNRRGRQVLNFRAEMGESKPRPVAGINDNANADFLWIFSQEFARGGHAPVYEFMNAHAQTHEARELLDAHVEWGSSPQEPLGELFVEGPPLEAGYAVVDQSWSPVSPGESSSPIDYYGDQVASGPYKKWWKQNFQMLYG